MEPSEAILVTLHGSLGFIGEQGIWMLESGFWILDAGCWMG